MNIYKLMIIVTAAAVIPACTHTAAPPTAVAPQSAGLSTADVSAATTWGASDNVRQIKHIYISSQPDEVALQRAREAGVTTVVNLREAQEYDWDEEAAVRALGMSYVHIPIPKQEESFDPATLQKIEQIVKQTHDSAVLLHCSSGNRAAAWLATHLAGAHGMPTADAMAIAGKAGLTHTATQQRTLRYIETH